ncbi:MAG: hypothetical protein STSR0009_00490 [Methanoregula sp.]
MYNMSGIVAISDFKAKKILPFLGDDIMQIELNPKEKFFTQLVSLPLQDGPGGRTSSVRGEEGNDRPGHRGGPGLGIVWDGFCAM